MKLWTMGLVLCLVAFVYGQNNEANKLNFISSSSKKLFTETTYKGTLREDNTIKIMARIETIEPCVDYEFVMDDGSDFSAYCVNNKIIITYVRSDVPRDGHLTLTLYAKSISDPAISDFTKIVLELPLTKVEKLFKESRYEGTLREDNSIHMKNNEIEMNELCAGYDFVVDDGNDFSANCVDNKIEITSKRSDVPRDGHLTLTLYARSISDPAISDFTKIVLELLLTKVEKLFKQSVYEGILREDNSILLIDVIETIEPCADYEFLVDDGSDFSAYCVSNQIEITHKNLDVPGGGHLTLTLYAKSIFDSAITDFTIIILELPVTKVEKLFKKSSFEGTLREDNSIHMKDDEIEMNKSCADYYFVVDDGNDFSANCFINKIEITHRKSDVYRDGHLTLTLYATSASDPEISDFTKIILELPVTKVEKLFKESVYEGILREHNSIQLIDAIETVEPCVYYEFVVDDGNDFSAYCVSNQIEITHKNLDVPGGGHLTLTLYAKSIFDSALTDFTIIILELPLTKVEKLFKEFSYEGTLEEDNSVEMIDEIETHKPCADYNIVVSDGNIFSVDCVSNKIEITHKHSDVPRGGHFTLTLYAKSIFNPAITDFTIIILELPLTKAEKLFKESSYEGTLREDNSIHMEVEIETNKPCSGYDFVVDDGNDFSAVCDDAKIKITHINPNVPRKGHLTLTLSATSTSGSATSDFTIVILELALPSNIVSPQITFECIVKFGK